MRFGPKDRQRLSGDGSSLVFSFLLRARLHLSKRVAFFRTSIQSNPVFLGRPFCQRMQRSMFGDSRHVS